MDVMVVVQSDHEAGLPSHRRMNGVPGKPVTKNRILSVCGHATNDIARIDVTQGDRNVLFAEIGFDLLSEENANVVQLPVARCILRSVFNLQQVLPGPFRNHHQSVRPLLNPPPQHGEEPILSLQPEWHLRDQREVDVMVGDGCTRGNESRVASH